MKLTNLLKSAGGALAMLLMVIGFTVATSTTAQAQSWRDGHERHEEFRRDRDRDRGRRFDRDDRVYGYGYNYGHRDRRWEHRRFGW